MSEQFNINLQHLFVQMLVYNKQEICTISYIGTTKVRFVSSTISHS